MNESPTRIDPNKQLKREVAGAHDQTPEEAYRWENYELFKKNLEEAFDQYNTNNDQYLSADEFKNFILDKAKFTHQEID